MRRVGQWTRLKEGCEEEYERWHRQVWPEVLEALKRAGISNYTIFRRGRDLFAYFELQEEGEETMASLEDNAICERWQEKMNQLMETGGEANPWKSMTEIFHLD